MGNIRVDSRQRLLSGIRQQLLPFLEDVLEFGLAYEAGRLEKALQMTTAIVHYYPETTQQEMECMLASQCGSSRNAFIMTR